ncbi:MAG: hypothetical protein A2V93_12770 [Ignavibacteria bacterium RBG_16_34_14]|nr:MAG: hypothetical protein A2V93_12770 [Ignavibacteria bacterium RBG_16_34_14]
MYEHFSKPLLPKNKFYSRIFFHFLGAFSLVLISLLIGIFGYHFSENLSWIDSLLNASMILGGMGPVNEMYSVTGKIFASFYSLFSGIIFLAIVGVLFAPLYHRFLHKFHLDN